MGVSARLRYEVMRRDNFTCRYCRSTDVELTIDHIVPRVVGGSNHPSNLATACIECNLGKASSLPNADTVDNCWSDLDQVFEVADRLDRGTVDYWCVDAQKTMGTYTIHRPHATCISVRELIRLIIEESISGIGAQPCEETVATSPEIALFCTQCCAAEASVFNPATSVADHDMEAF